MLLINLNTSTFKTFLQEHPDVNDLERFDDGEYYSPVLHEVCHIKRFELFKGI